MGTIAFYCGDGVSSFTIRRTYNGTTYTNTGTFNTYGFDDGTTVSLEGFALQSGYGYPVKVINQSTGGVYTYTSAGTAPWTFNSNYGAVSSSGYRIEATSLITNYYVTLYFDANGGSGAPSAQTYMGTSQYISVTIPGTIPSRSGYTFLGWSTSSTATSPSYYAGVTYSNWWASTSSSYGLTLYAVWQKKDTTYYAYLAYNANGGSGAPSQHQVSGKTETFNAQISSVVPTRSGYTFVGWWLYNIESYGTYQPGGLVPITGTAGSPSSTPHTLYAQWTKNASTGKVHIGNSYGFDSYTPYIWYNGGWHKAVPYVWYNGGWKKGV